MKLYSYCYSYLLLIICLSSCAVGPDFIKPAAPTAKAYTSEKNLNQFGSQHIGKNKPISAFWWHEFNDPELNRVIEQGVQTSYTLVSIREKLEQAKEMVNAASGQLWPQVNLNAIAGRQKYGVALFGPINISIPPFTYYELGPGLTYTLDIFGGTRRTIEKQQALACYQASQFNAEYLALTGNILTASLNIASINAQLETLNEITLEDKMNLNLVQKAFNFGSATKADVLSAKSQLTNDKALLPGLYQQLSLARDVLNVLIGKTPVDWQPPHFQLENFKLPQKLPLRLPSELAHVRPDILAAEALLHAASADIGIATANLYPAITLSASSMQEALIPANLFKSTANAWSYVSNITTPIFNGGTLLAQRRAAIHAYKASYADYQQAVLKAFVQVSDVLHALKHDEETEQLQKKAMTTAHASLKLARLSYSAGSVGVLEVIDAERLYMQARLSYVKVKGQRYQDIVQLYLVLGGGKNLMAYTRGDSSH
jgi:NodT family efflux transporter outer membrane factor (OMF) lipoprotein